ncbi:ECF transporter S component [Sporanaerobium hydrogeniformans]|uniref:ECF transporter S component n=1 Tax=Sporanaerobium hydrogeniformans TaxID=3072179 RepID=A0AC61DHP6_9FIRM|nr:ECF transporter S component [Sporanaerobium hydrogeniformans]PHV72022.1 ECF transporter S component [Sporanaerobium hydrogeniformans]
MKKNAKQLTSMAVLIALSIVLVYLIHFPIFPMAPFLEYDPADIPILIGTFVYGPVAGLVITIIAAIIQGTTVSAGSGWIGILMHVFATGSFVLVAGTIYKKQHTKKGAIIALIAGSITMTVTMVLWNLVFTPLFLGMPLEAVLPLLVPAIIPFNLLKASVNGAVSYLLYKRIKSFLVAPHQELSTIKE